MISLFVVYIGINEYVELSSSLLLRHSVHNEEYLLGFKRRVMQCKMKALNMVLILSPLFAQSIGELTNIACFVSCLFIWDYARSALAVRFEAWMQKVQDRALGTAE